MNIIIKNTMFKVTHLYFLYKEGIKKLSQVCLILQCVLHEVSWLFKTMSSLLIQKQK